MGRGMNSTTSGFSMVEVLVSLVVLAVGVIGAAGIQLSALRTTQQSGLHSSALQLAAEMADRIRANDSQMRRTDADNPFLALDYSVASDGEPAAPERTCFATPCGGGELADFDLYEWKRRLQIALPSARAVICRDRTPWNESGKALEWKCDGGAVHDATLVIKVGWQGKNPNGTLVQDEGGTFPPAIALVVSPYVP